MRKDLREAVLTIKAECKKNMQNCGKCGLQYRDDRDEKGERKCLINSDLPSFWPDPEELPPEDALAMVSDIVICGADTGCCDGCSAKGFLCNTGDRKAETENRRRCLAVLDAALKRLQDLEGYAHD